MKRQVAFAAIFLILSGAAALCLVEAGVRVMGMDVPRVWAPDPATGWRPIPGAHRHWTDEGDGLIQINSLGFRDVERQIERRPNIARVAVFGDSQTEADQVNGDQTYSARLEASLAARHQVEVLNMGVTGYSPVQELVLFRTEAPHYRPDVVVL